MGELFDAINQFVDSEYPDKEVEIYADYRDELSDDQILDILDSQEPMAKFMELLDDAYIDAYFDYRVEIENQFEDWCADNGYDYTSDDLSDNDIYIDEYIGISPDYDHFLDQDIHCRLIVDNGDANYEFTRNPNQDNDYQILSGAGIIWLGETLGYSVEQMQTALNQINPNASLVDDFTNPDKFLDSLVHESANAYGCPMLTFLCTLTLRDLIKFKENSSDVTVQLNGMNCGFFDGYNGGGSVLELECGRSEITIPANKIYSLVPDVRADGMYSVDEVYGLTSVVYDNATVN